MKRFLQGWIFGIGGWVAWLWMGNAGVAAELAERLRALPALGIARPAHGMAAVVGMGARLPAVAAAHGFKAHELRSMLLMDRTLGVDPMGRLFYAEDAPQETVDATPAVESPTVVGVAYPLSSTFQLHSRPGAKRTIYLDFNGHRLEGTIWNTLYLGAAPFDAPAWSMDSDRTQFSDTERGRIQQVWRRVAEDYAPFDVDVTTELVDEGLLTRTDLADEYYGVRVLISPISAYFGNYGGLAYVGGFAELGQFYKPALIFSDKLGPNVEKYMADAISHEAGHTLGLNHDGTTTSSYYNGHGSGETGWAPIMGIGYYRTLTQWSQGEYSGANNREDDLAVMVTRGLSYRPDDHGNTAQNATYFPVGSTLSGVGLIHQRDDVDVFKFEAGAGAATITLTPASPSGNLDILAELRDGAGALIATSNPETLLSASFQLTLAGGTYTLHVRGTGKGNVLSTGYSNYGSLGEYLVAGTVVAPPANVAPVAVVSASALSGVAPLVVAWNGGGSFDPDGSVTSWSWNFGDGAEASGAMVTHTFGSPGAYVVTLTVADEDGATGQTTATIVVEAPMIAPVAALVATGVSGKAPLTVTFDSGGSVDSDGSLIQYTWNFGDGSASVGPVATHVYTTPGIYYATLTVTDDDGLSSSTSQQITVMDPNVAPTAEVVASVLEGETPLAVIFDGAGSLDVDGTIEEYAWNFGDGTSGVGAVVTHVYASPGVYTAVLTVTDSDGATATSEVTVTGVAPNVLPVAIITATPSSGHAPLVVGYSGIGSLDSDGTIVSYQWSFTDGTTATGSDVQRSYTVAGTYEATLTVTDNRGGVAQTSVSVTVAPPLVPPLAVIQVSALTGKAPMTVHFEGAGSVDSDGTVAQYVWEFGDGATALGMGGAHVYTTPGVYSAVLTVTDNDGLTSTAVQQITVTAPNVAPVAVASASMVSGDAPLSVTLSGTDSSDSDGAVVGYAWTFGDGSLGEGAVVEHVYGSPGVYQAVLTVTDSDGATATSEVTVTVVAPNAPPVATVTATHLSGNAPLTVGYSGLGSTDSDGVIVAYQWSFSDGMTATGSGVERTYTVAGTYVATLVITDNRGGVAQTSVTVTVAPPLVPPLAVIQVSAAGGKAPLTVQFDGAGSADLDGTVVQYLWEFGDGATAVGTGGAHVYSSPGVYVAVLTVTDQDGLTSTALQEITVGAPNAAPTALAMASVASGDAPLSVVLDGAGSSDSDGTVVNYAWDFGDGSVGEGAVVEHVYENPGVYQAVLTVTDSDGATATSEVTVTVVAPNEPPVARVTASPISGFGPLTVTYSGATSSDADGAIVSYQWIFADGTTASGVSVAKTYGSVGTYAATLVVMDDRGGSASASVTVQVTYMAATVIRVQSIQLSTVVQTNGSKTVRAVVRVTNMLGQNVSGSTVLGSFSGKVTGTGTGVTDSAGNTTITSKSFTGSGSVTFSVMSLSKTGSTYLSSNNFVTSRTITVP